MAVTVPIVGIRRENPSVYLRPTAQAISHKPATSRKSQAMESSLKCFHLSHLPRSLLFVQRVRVRKTLQRKIMNLREKRTAYFSRGGSWRAEYPLVWRKCELPMPTAEVMG